MNEIKLRAWDKIEKRMLYRTIWDRNWYATPENDENGCHCVREITPNDKSTLELMQFTGIKDKNGTEIYGGDLLKTPFDTIVEVKWFEDLGYDGGGGGHSGFYYKDELDYYTNLDELEIVGNKYDNPVLLQKEIKYDEEN